MTIEILSEKTIASKFKRLSYFHGMLLTEDDLLEEQNYFRDKLKLHNRLHGKGIVQGLEIKPFSETKDATGKANKDCSEVVIQPGFALDCEGNEVIVCRPYEVDLSMHIDFLIRECALNGSQNGTCMKGENSTPRICLGIIFGECRSNPSTQYIATCDSDPQKQYSRIREGFRVSIVLEYETMPPIPEVRNASRSCISSSFQCSGVDPECTKGMVIPLAYILIRKDESAGYAVITKNKIIMNGVRNYAWTALSLQKWELARQTLLACSEIKECDLSCVIGRSKSEALQLLQQMHMNVDKEYLKTSALTEKHLEIIRTSKPIVKEGSIITLVTDESGEKIEFAITSSDIPKEKDNYTKVKKQG
ncbi:hypothetical protein JW979_15155 [bacterium]|nr:hypothetical protein [candidate division CSSED10-310 bacterium]